VELRLTANLQLRPCRDHPALPEGFTSGVRRGPGGAAIDGSSAPNLPPAVLSTTGRACDTTSDVLVRPRRIRQRCRIPIASGRWPGPDAVSSKTAARPAPGRLPSPRVARFVASRPWTERPSSTSATQSIREHDRRSPDPRLACESLGQRALARSARPRSPASARRRRSRSPSASWPPRTRTERRGRSLASGCRPRTRCGQRCLAEERSRGLAPVRRQPLAEVSRSGAGRGRSHVQRLRGALASTGEHGYPDPIGSDTSRREIVAAPGWRPRRRRRPHPTIPTR